MTKKIGAGFRLIGGALILALGASGAAAQERQTSEQCPTVGGVLKFARAADVSDWYYQGNNPTIWAWPLVNLPLVRNNLTATDLEGAAAESWEANEDYTRFTFTLREGLKFSDGSALTSADVLASISAAGADPQNAGRILEGTTFEAPDDRTFIINLPSPQPAFVESQLTQFGIYPKAADPQAMLTAPVSAGPFVLAEWQKGQVARLTRNPHYWNQPYPCLDEVQLLVVGDATTQALQLQAGQIDIAQELPPVQLESLRGMPGVTVPVFPTLAEQLIRLQRVTQPAFADVNVRKAMNYAIDKAAIAEVVFFGTASEMNSEMPRTKYYVPQTPYSYDLAKAKEHMAASGFPNGFATELLIASGDPVETGISTIVKAQLAEIGITVNIQQVEAGTKFDLRNNRQFEMFLASTSADQIDPQGFWSFCCAAQRSRGSAFTDYIEDDMIALYNEATKTGGPRREEIFAEMQKIGWEDAAQLFLVFIDAPIGVRSNVQGFVVPPTRTHVLETVYKTE